MLACETFYGGLVYLFRVELNDLLLEYLHAPSVVVLLPLD